MTAALDDRRWTAVRDRRPDPGFIFAVRTTRIACRPGCPSRTPSRANVRFFDDFAAAAQAGFRACKRCAPDAPAADTERRALIARACELLDAQDATPAAVAGAVGLSRYHFQRVFRAVTGVTPGAYVRERRDARFRERLRAGDDVTRAIAHAGYGSSSRAYERDRLGMTPTAYRNGARGEKIAYAIADCALGRVLVASTLRGICAIELAADDAGVLAAFERDFPLAERVRDERALRDAVAAVVALIADPSARHALELDVRGSAFQQRVWGALRALPPGRPATYGELARAVGSPRGAQAVGAACGANRLAVAIPCHRVVREDGSPAGYKWGLDRKLALLAREREG